MISTRGYAALNAESSLAPFEFSRREVGASDILIEILYCGVCHSDIHQARNEWGGSTFPMVPGHEIVGKIRQVGADVRRFAENEIVGVGCFVDSCRSCPSCKEGVEQYCEGHLAFTYNGLERDKKTPTQGGYSNKIVVNENYVLKVPANLELSHVAPLLCAGITTYSPLRHWNVKNGSRVAVVGLGGLGHMAIKFAVSFGAEVTVLSTSRSKEADARRLGAHNFLLISDTQAMEKIKGSLDFILDTASAPHDLNIELELLKRDGALVVVGVPPKPPEVHMFPLITKRRQLAGSLIGGIKETQEMLDYCGQKGIVSDVELIAMKDVNEAYERVLKGDVKYRFVIDLKTL